MRSENIPTTRLSFCPIATILAPLWAITVDDHDGDGSIWTRDKINAVKHADSQLIQEIVIKQQI